MHLKVIMSHPFIYGCLFYNCRTLHYSSTRIDNRDHLMVPVSFTVSLPLCVRTSICRSESCTPLAESSLDFFCISFKISQTGESSSECNTPFLVSGQEISEAVPAASLHPCNSYSLSHPILGSCHYCVPPCHKHPDSWHYFLCVNSHRICSLHSVSSPHS